MDKSRELDITVAKKLGWTDIIKEDDRTFGFPPNSENNYAALIPFFSINDVYVPELLQRFDLHVYKNKENNR